MAELNSNLVAFEVLTDETVPFRIGMELEVYKHDDPNQIIDVVPHRTDVSALDELGGNGGGNFTVMRDDPKLVESPELLNWRNLVRVRLDREVVGGFLIQNRETKYVDPDELAGEYWKVTGEGLRTWFRDAVVLSYGGVREDSQDVRVFSFASERGSWYKTGEWISPFVVHPYSLDPNPTYVFGTAPAEWPDAPSAKWIWGMANGKADPADEGVNYFRYEFDIDVTEGTRQYSVFSAAKDDFDIYMDAAQVITSREKNGYAKTWRADFDLAPGHHILAARVLNKGGNAGLITALFKFGDADAGTAAELITVTGGSGWVVNAYPDPAPGWTPGEIMLTLLQEAEDRGVRFPTWLTPTFTADVDSDGAPWPRSLDWSFNLGTEYIDVIEKLEELVCDVWINPGNLELNMYATRGVHRDIQSAAVQPVKFEIGRNVSRAGDDGTSDIKNTLLVQSEAGWGLQADGLTDSISTYGRIEGFISTGASKAVSGDVAQKVFSQKAKPELSATLDIIDVDDARPFVDFHTGDWVLAPGDDGKLTSRRVMSISVTEDAKTGKPKFAVEIDTIFEDRATRYARWLKTTSDGTLGGTLANVSGGGGGGGGTPTSQTAQPGPQGLRGDIGPIGMNWRGEWSASIEYLPLDAVSYEGASWFALLGSSGEVPNALSTVWELIADKGGDGPAGAGLTYQGAWNSAATYNPNDIVDYGDQLWITAVENTNKVPGVATEWDEYGGGGGGSMPTRSTTTYLTGTLALGDQETGLVTLAPGYRIYKISATRQSRVRLYDTVAHRDSDLSRNKSTELDPAVDHGLMFEVALQTGTLSRVLSPVVDGVNFESGDGVPITIQNLDSSGSVLVTLTFVKTE